MILLLLRRVSPIRPAPANLPRPGTEQGSVVERCDVVSLPYFSFFSFFVFRIPAIFKRISLIFNLQPTFSKLKFHPYCKIEMALSVIVNPISS